MTEITVNPSNDKIMTLEESHSLKNTPFTTQRKHTDNKQTRVALSAGLIGLLFLLPTLILASQLKEEFLRVEDELRDVLSEEELECNISDIETFVQLSFISTIITLIPVFLLFCLLFLFICTGSLCSAEIKNNWLAYLGLPGFCLFFPVKLVITCIVLSKLTRQLGCLSEIEDFEELREKMRSLIIMDWIFVVSFLPLCGMSYWLEGVARRQEENLEVKLEVVVE